MEPTAFPEETIPPAGPQPEETPLPVEDIPRPEETLTPGETSPSLPEEAREAIFDFNIGDAEVDFYLEGSWLLTFFAATGLLITPEGDIRPLDLFPAFADGFYFQQEPNLTLSVWILEKYFLEVTYQGKDKDNLFLTGYEGGEEDLIRHVYVGNTNITLSPSPYLEIPETGNSSIGTHTLIQTPASQHELLLRYDYNTSGKKIFKGRNEVVEIRYSPEEYKRGRYFKLPDNNIKEAKVYLQDPYGTLTDPAGRKFKKADARDIILDTDRGSLFIKEEIQGRILVYYSKNDAPVGDPANGIDALVGEDIGDNSKIDVDADPVDFSFGLIEHLGQDMTDREVMLSNGLSCLLLYEPGLFSPFDISSTYEVSDDLPDSQWMVETSIVKKGTYMEFPLTRSVLFTCDRENKQIIVYADNNLGENFRNLYPFIDTSPDIYGPGIPANHISSGYEILLELLYPVTEYYLDPDVIPGSIRVIRNGIEEKRFLADYESGIITFQVDILPTDRLVIYYKRKFESFDNGDIIFGWKNKIHFTDTTFLELSTGLKWNAIPGTYTEKAYSKTGSVLGLCSFQTSMDHFDLAVTGAASLTNPDTTGIFRLLGMEETGLDIALSEETAWPCSVPANHGAEIFPGTERGKLFYKDYREYGINGNYTLKPITWDIPDDHIFSYKTGSKPGPYLVANASSSSTDSSLVMDFEIPADKKWTGIQIPVIQGKGTMDLSHISSLSLSVMALDLTGDIKVYIQTGEITEDIDNDGLLDEEPSRTATGFIFNDTSNGVNLKIGSGSKNKGNSRKDSEDVDGNRFLDPEVEDRLVSKDTGLTLSAGDTTWQRLNIFFTDPEKEQLARSRFIRIVIASEETGSVTGKLLIDKIFLAGEIRWQKKWLGSGSMSTEELEVREIYESFAVNKPDSPLDSHEPEVRSIFHSRGEPQKVLEIQWDHIEEGEGWELSHSGLPQVESIRYEELSLYIRVPETPDSDEQLAFSLLDHLDRGIRVELPLERISAWKKLTVNLKTKKAYLDSEEIDAELEIDGQYMSFTTFSVSLVNSGIPESSGTLYIDEVHLTSPQLELGAAVTLETKAEIPGPLLTYHDFPILSDFYISEKASFVTKGFAPLYGQAASAMVTQSLTEISLGVMFTKLDMDLSITGEDDEFSWAGGHSLTIPGNTFPVQFIDAYTITPGVSGNNFYRSNTCTVKDNDDTTVFSLSTSSYTLDTILVQNWDMRVLLLYRKLVSFSSLCSYLVSSDSFQNKDNWYIPAWFYGFQYIIPVENDILDERSGRLSFDFSLNSRPVGTGLAGKIHIGSNTIKENYRNYVSNTDLLLSFPVTLVPSETLTFILTPSYSRFFSVTTFLPEQGTYSDDVQQWGNDLEEHTYLFNQVPFIELYSGETEKVFTGITGKLDTDSVAYTPVFAFSLAKESPGSGLFDLFLPSSLDFSISKRFQKSFALYDFYHTYTISAQFSAINLFGKFGAYSLFDFYAVDEFQTNATIEIITRDEEIQYGYEFINFISFTDSKQNKFLIENHLLLHQDDFFDFIDFGSLSYEWNIIPEKHFPLPLIPKEVVDNSYYTHVESLAYSLNNYDNPEILSEITITLSHATFLQFPPNGYIKAGFSLGYNVESATPDYQDIQATRIAFQLGLESQIQW